MREGWGSWSWLWDAEGVQQFSDCCAVYEGDFCFAKIASSWGPGESEGVVGAVGDGWGATGDGDARKASSSWGDAWIYGLVDIPERRGKERLSSSKEGTITQDQQSVRTAGALSTPVGRWQVLGCV